MSSHVPKCTLQRATYTATNKHAGCKSDVTPQERKYLKSVKFLSYG